MRPKFGFPKESRLLKRAQFLALSQREPRPDLVVTAGSFLVLGRRNSLGRNRLGVTVTKKVAPRAVARNRIKRQVREFFRLAARNWPQGLDLLFIARQGAAQAARPELGGDLRRAGRKLAGWDPEGGRNDRHDSGGGASPRPSVPEPPDREARPLPAPDGPDGAFNIITCIQQGPGRLALGFIRFYQRFISPFTPPACRFWPTCSNYAAQAIRSHGFWRGCWLALRRLLKCHPFHPGGYDPVPPRPERGHASPKGVMTKIVRPGTGLSRRQPSNRGPSVKPGG